MKIIEYSMKKVLKNPKAFALDWEEKEIWAGDIVEFQNLELI
jgi:hypothetical protein